MKKRRYPAILLTLCMACCLAASVYGGEVPASDISSSGASAAGVTLADDSASAEAEKPADIGYYTLTSMTEGGETYGLDILSLIGADSWYLELREDYSGTLSFGEADAGELTWTPGVLTADGESINYTLEGDSISIKEDDVEMVFTRSDSESPAAAPAAEGDPASETEDVTAAAEPVPDSDGSTEAAVTIFYGDGSANVSAVDDSTKPAEPADGTLVETGFFSFTCGGDWVFDPANVSDYDDYAYAYVEIPDSETGWALVSVSISVEVNEPFSFAETLHNNGMDLYDAIKLDAYETTPIGGMNFWVADDGSCTEYYGYDQVSDTFVVIRVNDSEYLEQAQEIISSLHFTCPEYSGAVTPMYWEGEPYRVAPHTTTVGSFTVESKQLTDNLAYPTYDSFSSRVAVSGDTYYLLQDGALEEYTRSGDELTYQIDWTLPYEPRELMVDANGIPCISAFLEGLTRLDSDTGTTIAPDASYVKAHPSGGWGISYFSNGEIARIDFASGAVENVTLPGISLITNLAVTENYLVVSAGLDDEDSTACLKIYDFDYNEVGYLDADDTGTGYYGSVSAFAETSNGLMAFDGNMRDVYFLDHSLNLIATVDMADLIGSDYPWPCNAVTLEDGSVVLCMTDERADDSADETVLIQLSGF